MYDMEDDRPQARPAGPPAAPPIGVPVAQPAFESPIAQAVPARFPQLASSRRDALVDIAFVACYSLAFEALLVAMDVPETLRVRWPEIGIIGVNALLGVFNLLLVVAVLVLRSQRPATIGLSRSFNARTLLWAVVAVPGCYVGSMCGALIYGLVTGFDTQGMLAEKAELADMISAIPMRWIFPFALFVGIHEEILFRGFYLSRVRALSRSGVVAIIATSVVFGLLHYYQGWLGIFQTTAIGLVLAIIVTYARSLWPAVIAHAVFDATNMLLLPWLLKTMQELEKAA